MGGRLRKPDQTATPEAPIASEPLPPTDFALAEGRIKANEETLLIARDGLVAIIKSGGADSATYRELGSIVRALTQIEVERRGQRKLQMAATSAYTMEGVLSWIRQQSEDRRSHLMREMDQMGKGSVLA